MKFSERYELTKEQSELDFVDITIGRDIPLFIDPYIFSLSDSDWDLDCHQHVISFFQSAIDYIRTGEKESAKSILNGLSEPNETHLGLSIGRPRGRGVSGKQALDIYNALVNSEAVRTGLISEISDCELMIDGVGPDKISDITTNIVRKQLIEYTQEQCLLHGIQLREDVPSGRIWNPDRREWREEYVRLPVIDGEKIILVPKSSVRWKMSMDHREYYQHFVLNFLRDREYRNPNSSLVRLLKSGEPRVYKKYVAERYPISKDFLFRFSLENPEVLDMYKTTKGLSPEIRNEELNIDFDERAFAQLLIDRLEQIPPGIGTADEYHSLMVGVLEFIFFPNLIYPKKETPIHGGRKRIDITYTNNAKHGFFRRVHISRGITANRIMVECKNYSSDASNPELDQLAGRFSANRGWVGFLVSRTFRNRALFLNRCRDTAQDQRGYIIPFVDEDIENMLGFIRDGIRNRIDPYIEDIFVGLLH